MGFLSDKCSYRIGSVCLDSDVEKRNPCEKLIATDEHLSGGEVLNPFLSSVKDGVELTCFTKCENDNYHVINATCKSMAGITSLKCNIKSKVITDNNYLDLWNKFANSSLINPDIKLAGAGVYLMATAAASLAVVGYFMFQGCSPRLPKTEILDSWVAEVEVKESEEKDITPEQEQDQVQEVCDAEDLLELEMESETSVPDEDVSLDEMTSADEGIFDEFGVDLTEAAEEAKPDIPFVETEVESKQDISIVDQPLTIEFKDSPLNEPADEASCNFDTKPTYWKIQEVTQDGEVVSNKIKPSFFTKMPAADSETSAVFIDNLGNLLDCPIKASQDDGDPIVRWNIACENFLGIYEEMNFFALPIIIEEGEAIYFQLKGEWGEDCSSTFEFVYKKGEK